MAVLGDRLSEVDRDEEALAWYVKAAESGLVQAMFAAGSWYRGGFGTRPDPVQALRWFLAMQNQGSRDGTHAAVELGTSRVLHRTDAGLSMAAVPGLGAAVTAAARC
jgi:hypothetical protein